MIDLYASASPNVTKIFVALEEMELPYRAHRVDLMKEEQFRPEFLKLNPLGKVPVIVDQDAASGRPHTVFESGAILLYLAEKSGKFLPTNAPERSEAIQWLVMQVTNVGPMVGQYVHFARFAPEEATTYARDRYRTQVRRLLDVIEGRLGQSAFIGGAAYTIADIALVPWMRAIDYVLGAGADKDYPKISAWAVGISARPAVVRAVAALEAIAAASTPIQQASEQARDRFFGRGAYSRS
jgi:GST-like protein